MYKYNKKIHTYSFKMLDHASIFQAELEAIYQPCAYLEDSFEQLKPKYVKILTDSQAALKTLAGLDFTSEVAVKTAEALENLN